MPSLHPVREAWNTGSHPGISQAEEQAFPFIAQSVSDITTRNLDRTFVIHLMISAASYRVYHYDPTNTAAEDGVNVILDSEDRPFVLVSTVNSPANWMGDYTAVTTYAEDDLVTYNGSTWRSLEDGNLGNTPFYGSTHWAIVAQAGSPGGPISIEYTFKTSTGDADPGDGCLRLSSSSHQSDSTTVRVDLKDNLGNTWTGILDTLAASTSTIKGFVKIGHKFDETKWLAGTLTALASPSGYRNLTVSLAAWGMAGQDPFSADDPLLFEFVRNGDKGDTGATGATGNTGDTGSTGATGATGRDAGINYKFNSSTSGGNPGSGKFAISNSGATLDISKTDDDGNNIGSELATWDDGTSSTKGKMIAVKVAGAALKIVTITGAAVDNTSYLSFPCSVQTFGSFSDNDESFGFFVPNGDKGDTGATGATGANFDPDAVVDAIEDRDAYDDEAAFFSVLVTADSGNGDQPTLYFKLSASHADWSGGITWVPTGSAGVSLNSTTLRFLSP